MDPHINENKPKPFPSNSLNRSPKQHLPRIPDILWDPLAAAALMISIGLLGVFTNTPLLFPSLGPTAFLQIENPELKSARFYNTVVGHLIGLISGVLAVLLFNANQFPSVMETGRLDPARIFASALAIGLTIAIGLLLHASHPPASATTLLVALGGFRLDLRTILVVMSGVLLIGVLGEGMRRARLARMRK
jgi:CBS-domain-containing membrane protein